MVSNNYFRPGPNNNVILDCNNLPDSVFLDAVRTKEICKIKLLSNDEVKSNNKSIRANIKVTSTTGENYIITRKQLIENFTHANGSKIKVALLRTGKEYIVFRYASGNFKMLKLPDNCIGDLNGNRVKQGSYLIAPVNDSGEIIKDKLITMSPALFRKSFKVPMQDIIKQSLNTEGNKFFTLFNSIRNRDKMRNSLPEIPSQRIKINNTSSNNVQQPIQQRSNQSLNLGEISRNVDTSRKDNNKQVNQNNQENGYKYRLINQVVDNINNPKQLGYTVEEISTGRTKQFSTVQVSKMCEKHLVENAMIVTDNRGIKYLRGNGIQLRNLPKVLP